MIVRDPNHDKLHKVQPLIEMVRAGANVCTLLAEASALTSPLYFSRADLASNSTYGPKEPDSV